MEDKGGTQAAIGVMIVTFIIIMVLLSQGEKGTLITLLVGGILAYLLSISEE